MRNASLPINIGEVVCGKYVVERLLGQGGMGVVFVARVHGGDQRVAIKFLLPTTMESVEALIRFEREAWAAAALKTEHVARVYDVGQSEQGVPFLVMELLDGEDLAEMLCRRGPLPVSEAISILLQACEAMAEAHELEIVHRDLKPANIFLARCAEGTQTVKVLDFGISKAPTAGGIALTSTRDVMGSPAYMSPEQLREARNVDGRTDIWSMGVTLYELLSGTLPFAANALAEMTSNILTSSPTPIHIHRGGIPPDVDAIVTRCLQKNPANRYQSVGELSVALRQVGECGPTTALVSNATETRATSAWADTAPAASEGFAQQVEIRESVNRAPARRVSPRSLRGLGSAIVLTAFFLGMAVIVLRVSSGEQPLASAAADTLSAMPAVNSSLSPPAPTLVPVESIANPATTLSPSARPSAVTTIPAAPIAPSARARPPASHRPDGGIADSPAGERQALRERVAAAPPAASGARERETATAQSPVHRRNPLDLPLE